ncbi:GNAT family N-acetyltransferase [Paenibacillus sp. OAS669]|uniref:GNAT family N-acetyltransferase n=1 Tax=Paenibacillus sp. OAS669 TaxID=2663821 RepID=UPI001788FE69|nr:N-acetyltransferase [Paenibacillus sp. OAS669]MBE1443413.1 putative N-acetyltransferase YhbS [Paenibacillus sp. OAS669]
MEIMLRTETPDDYGSIAELHAHSFTYGFGIGESTLTSLLRNRRTYDPELSIVAESRGRVVGHVLFTPQSIMVKDNVLQAVILAPLAVHPDFRLQGIGSMLVEFDTL